MQQEEYIELCVSLSLYLVEQNREYEYRCQTTHHRELLSIINAENPVQRSNYLNTDEKYQLNDIFQLKLTMEEFPESKTKNIQIKLSLYFLAINADIDELNSEQNIVESITLQVDDIEKGVFHYYEAEFKKVYASSLSLIVFAMVNGYKLYPYTMKKSIANLSEEEKNNRRKREQIRTLDNFVKWAQNESQICKNCVGELYNRFGSKLRLNSYTFKNRVYSYSNIKPECRYRFPKFSEQHENENLPLQQFQKYLKSIDCQTLSISDYNRQILQLYQQNYFFSQQIMKKLSNKQIKIKQLQNQFKSFVYNQNNTHVVRDIILDEQLVNISHAEQNIKNAEYIRKHEQDMSYYPIQDIGEKMEEYLFYQICYSKQYHQKQVDRQKKYLPYQYQQKNMMIFLCHGFHASSSDMRIIQRGIKDALPSAKIYASSSNEIDTDCDIDSMGQKLAEEVKFKIKYEGLKDQKVILSFVGHSMGGIIVRAALKYLKKYQNQLGFYCSLSSPHLGYMNGTDGMIKAGMMVMKIFMKQSKSLNQLSMSDTNEPQKSFLYRLSTEGSLKKFKKIILISSAQDSYVPWHSARICGYEKKKTNDMELKMAEMILGDSTIHRIDVNFACEKKDIDGLIGRKAHINLLVNYYTFKLINSVLTRLFDVREI